MPVPIAFIVVNFGELLGRLKDLSCWFLGDQRGFWRRQVIEDIIDRVSNFFKKLSSEVSHCRVSKVVLYLLVDGPHELSVLVVPPLVKILSLLKSQSQLPLQVLYDAFRHGIIEVARLEFFNMGFHHLVGFFFESENS